MPHGELPVLPFPPGTLLVVGPTGRPIPLTIQPDGVVRMPAADLASLAAAPASSTPAPAPVPAPAPAPAPANAQPAREPSPPVCARAHTLPTLGSRMRQKSPDYR